MNGLVSVILPVYNVEKYIREALDSVINQTYKNLEIILVDDGSPDSSGDICDEYAAKDDRIRVIHKENGGVSSARNAGIEAARGDWIYFIDPDDWIEPDTLEAAVGMAAENGCDMCMFDFEMVYRERSVCCISFKGKGTVFKYLTDERVFLPYACTMGAVWRYVTRAECVKKLRFDENFSMREDELFTWELYGKIKSLCYVNSVFYHYRCIFSSASNSLTAEALHDNALKIYNRELEIISSPEYPENAAIAAHSKYIELFFAVCTGIFSSGKTFNERINDYRRYISRKEFTDSVSSFTPLYFSKAARIVFKRKKAPSWLWAYALVKAKALWNIIKCKNKF